MKQFWINVANFFKAIAPWVKFAWAEFKQVKADYKTQKALENKDK